MDNIQDRKILEVNIMKIKILSVAFIIIIVCSIISPILSYYNEFYSNDIYYETYHKSDFDELFYNPPSKKCEVYEIGGFGYVDSSLLAESPEMIDYYVELGIKVFDSNLIDELMRLLEQCNYIPIKKEKAFSLNLLFNPNNKITSLAIDIAWFYSEDNPLFSEKIIEEINGECYGISECSIYELEGKLYLIASFPYQIMGAGHLKYERPNFGETLTSMYEIEMTEEAVELLERKDDFYVGENDGVFDSPINYKLIVSEFAVCIIIVLLAVIIKKKRHKKT